MLVFLKSPRVFFWFLKTFVAKNKSHIILSFLLAFLLSLYWYSGFFVSTRNLFSQENSVALIGNYNLTNLPLDVQRKISFGLTKITDDDRATPGASLSWEIKNNGRTYTFKLNQRLRWHDNSNFRSFDINYRLKDVEIAAIGDNIVEFKLKEPYASLPMIVSQPLFKKGLTGLGDYKVSNITWKDEYIERLDLVEVNNRDDHVIYKFYSNFTDAYTALKLKKVSRIEQLTDSGIVKENSDFKISSNTIYHSILTLFYNSKKEPFSEKLVRTGLSYAIPDSTRDGETKATGPISKTSWYFNTNLKDFSQNLTSAKRYLKDLTDPKNSTKSTEFKIRLDTLPAYKNIAEVIATSWKDLGIKTTVVETKRIMPDFDVFLGAIVIPEDPDQYFLWHSTAPLNVANLNSPRIDKILEDARKINDEEVRKTKYQEFQKFLVEENPALFLFYTKNYTITRL